MVIINTISDKYFSLDGISYARIYQPLTQGSAAIGIFNKFDTSQQLVNSTNYDEYQINGVTFSSQEDTISELLTVVYSTISESGFESLKGRVTSNENKIANLEDNQITSVQVYETYADLPTTGTDKVSYKVVGDTAALNGYYHWNSGYIKDKGSETDEAIDNINSKADLNTYKADFNDRTIHGGDYVEMYGASDFDLSTLIDETIIYKNGGTITKANYKTTPFIVNPSLNNPMYLKAFFNEGSDTEFLNVAFYDSSGVFLNGGKLGGSQIIKVYKGQQVRLSSYQGFDLIEVADFSTEIVSTVDSIASIKASIIKYNCEWLYSYSFYYANRDLPTLIRGIKAIQIDLEDAVANNEIILNVFATDADLGSSYDYACQFHDRTDGLFYATNQSKKREGLEVLTFNRGTKVKIQVLVNWDEFPDVYQWKNQGTLAPKKNFKSFVLSEYTASRSIGNLEVLGIGTSIPEGSKYFDYGCERLGYVLHNNAVGSSGIVKTTGWAFNTGRDGKDLSETVAEKEARYRQYVTSGAITETILDNYKEWSYENLIIKYINGSRANCTTILFDHGYNDNSWIAAEVGGVGSVDWNPDATADRTTFVGAFKFLIAKIYEVNPNVRIIICGFTEDKSSTSVKHGEVIKTMLTSISEGLNLKYLNVSELLGFNFKYIPNSSNYLSDINTEYGTSFTKKWEDANGNITFFQYYCPDGIHPHSDPTGRGTDRIKFAYANLLRNNL